MLQAIHSCAVRFPDVAASVVHLLMDFLGDLNTAPALDVVFFVREIMETNPKLRPTILVRLLDSFGTIRSSRVCTCALWIVGEYCTSAADISAALEVPRQLAAFFWWGGGGGGYDNECVRKAFAGPCMQFG